MIGNEIVTNGSCKISFISLLGEGTLIFRHMGSQENYCKLVGHQNDNNNPQFQGWHI